jgi:putative ATP-binding cassette transporter
MAVIAVTGVVSGLCSAAILAIINRALYGTGSNLGLLLLALLALIVGKIVSGIASRWLLIKYAQQMLLDLSSNLCRQVLSAPLRLVEETGVHRVLTALTTDVPALGTTLQALPALTVNVAIIVGCLAYLCWLYPMGLVAMVVAVGLGAAIYFVLHKSATAAIRRARRHRDDLMKSFRELTEGIKELKMNRARREDFLQQAVDVAAGDLKRENLLAMRKYLYLDAWSQALFYSMLAGVLFFFPRDGANAAEVLTGFAFAALYMMTPMWALLGALPTLAVGATSLAKLEEIGLAFTGFGTGTDVAARPAAATERVELVGVEFNYRQEGVDFKLGPIDLALDPGEVVFLIGGNGSGKTTLVKLLIGLYSPHAGELRLNGEPVTDANRDWYRQHFSVVFFDFHLFDRLLGTGQEDLDAVANRYLEQLELSHKIQVVDGGFSSTSLSQGQRKRLALLTALIEERPICVFDEWAADQDPHYKQIFYSKILPMLRAHNKTVLVVTHDDRYFHHGDRVIKLEDGKIASSDRRRVKTA